MTFEEWWSRTGLQLDCVAQMPENPVHVVHAAWQAAQPKWRPIETAPTSGTFIAWAGGRPFEAYRASDGRILSDRGIVAQPTHWTSMPEAPHE